MIVGDFNSPTGKRRRRTVDDWADTESLTPAISRDMTTWFRTIEDTVVS